MTCLVSLEHEGRVELIMTEWDSRDQKPRQSPYEGEILGNNIVKYFVHGILFAIFLPAFNIAIDFLFLTGFTGVDIYSALTVLGLIAIFLPLLFGYLNGEFARRLWGLNPRQAVTTWYGQGLLIFFMLPLFGSFYYYLILFVTLFAMIGFSELIVILIVLILLDAIASGYIGRHVAAEFEGAREGSEELASVSDRHIVCPHCKLRFMRQKSNADFNGLISCPHCGGKVSEQPGGPQPTDSFDSFD